MIHRSDPDNISIRIPIRGRAALIRYTLIGAVIGAALITESVIHAPMGKMLLTTLLGGIGAGGFAMLTAWLGQLAARHPESTQRPNNPAILNAGLIGGALGIIAAAYLIIWTESGSIAGNFAPISALLSVGFGLLSGGALGAILTSTIAIFMLIQARIAPATPAPHLLNQSQFDPLQHIEEVPDHVRR